MGKIISIKDLPQLKKEKAGGKTMVLAGGCFDIIHPGHIEFLKRSKKLGDILAVALESDKKVKELKGPGRPINSQSVRAKNLSDLPMIDYVVNLPYLKKDNDYEILVKSFEPDIIALTKGSPVYDWEKEYMRTTGGKIVEVMERRKTYSTTKLIKEKLKV